MKRLILAAAIVSLGTSAFADDWSGFYLGGHAGYGWGDATSRQDPDDWGDDPKWIGPFPYDLDGAFGGFTAGVNQQMDSIVMGLEADVGYMDISGSRTSESSNPIYHQDHTVDGGLYADFTARLGVAVNGTLFYGKGGFAVVDGDAAITTTKPGYLTNSSGAFTGWVVGGGVEHKFANGWSVKAEYLHFDFGSQSADQTSITDPPIGHVYENWTDVTADTVKLGVNYHFN